MILKFTCFYNLISLVITFLWTGKTYVLIVTLRVTLLVSTYFLSRFLRTFTCSKLLVLRKIYFVPHRHGVFAWNVWPPKTMQRLTRQRTKRRVYGRARNWTQVSLRCISLRWSTATILIFIFTLVISLGAYHDGDGNTCPDSAGSTPHLMSPQWLARNRRGTMKWSWCSKAYIHSFLKWELLLYLENRKKVSCFYRVLVYIF